ncbi:vitellogenin-2-like [Tachypleus tridentatus]|uniref:vitellogenin-2-like n=1 Tax=Tachypleus tridentatus TaxID=6853 RepID=UPI003FD0B969
MRGETTLLLLACVVLTVVCQRAPEVFSSWHHYHYDYHARLLAGLPTVNDQYSGLEIWADLKLYPTGSQLNYGLSKFILKLDGVQVAKLHRSVSDLHHTVVHKEYAGTSVYQEKLSIPVIVHIEGNLVKYIEVDNTDPIWSVNMKRAVLSTMQMKVVPKNPDVFSLEEDVPLTDDVVISYKVYEDGIGGNCETYIKSSLFNHLTFPVKILF